MHVRSSSPAPSIFEGPPQCTAPVASVSVEGPSIARFAAIFEGLPIALALRRGFGDSDGGLLREVTNRQNQG